MAREMLVEQEYLSYTGTFSRPIFKLWAQGGVILEGLYDALSPFGVKFADFRLEGNAVAATDVGITATYSNRGTQSFRFDRVECKFFNIDSPFFESVPSILEATRSWLRQTVPTFKFASHQFTYMCHSRLKDASAIEMLQTMTPTKSNAAGIEQGKGLIFHWLVPARKWEAHLILDRSTVVNDAMYLAFTLTTTSDESTYQALAAQGREYLVAVLKDLGFQYPSPTP